MTACGIGVGGKKAADKWIFSLTLPSSPTGERPSTIKLTSSSHNNNDDDDLDAIENDEILYTAHDKTKKGNSERTISSSSSISSDLIDDAGRGKINETRSLLDDKQFEEDKDTNNNVGEEEDDNDDDRINYHSENIRNSRKNSGLRHSKCCWKFYNSFHGLSLQSSSLLRLSYRPAWQSIPEYTKGKRHRALYRSLSSWCCPSSLSSSSDEDDAGDYLKERQIWEVYTTEHIHKTNRVKISIRGIGECQALQIYLNPINNGENTNNPAVDLLDTPREYQAPLKLHQERSLNAKQQNKESSWTRFNEPGDSGNDTTNGNENNNEKCRTTNDSYIVLTFAMPLHPEFLCSNGHDTPLLWKVDIPSPTSDREAISLDTITVLDGTVDLQEPATHVYIEGFQSWSFSGSVWKGQPQPTSAMPNIFSGAFNLGGCLPEPPTTVLPSSCWGPNSSILCNLEFSVSEKTNIKSRYKSDFFTCITTGNEVSIDENGGPALVCGWLSQHKQFGVVLIDSRLENLTMHATHEAMMIANSRRGDGGVSTDWSYAQLITPHRYDEEPMVHYLHAVAAFHQAEPLQNGPLLTGWCSWYHYYENITEDNLRTNFHKLASLKHKIPTNMAMVDDGYMTAWGDWDSLKPKKFTTMDVVASDIQSSGMRPGLWLAPFAADKHSKIAKHHPEWIITNEGGSPANSSNCGKFFYGLDATNPRVREHVFISIRRAVQDWGFRVLKIDFLYAACLEGNGKYDMSMTRAETMHLALKTIREAAGPTVFLIGCGCPIGSGVGYIDGMRVSADTGPTWYPELPLPWWDNGTLPSLRGMIRNSMSRAPMGHRWWQNDPDCLLLGETTKLTHEEVVSAASIIAMTCGMLLVSDDLTKVSQERMQVLSRIFPMTGVSGVILDLHNTKNKGMPSLIRLWCTDRYFHLENFRASPFFHQSLQEEDFSAEATHFGKQSAFNRKTFAASSSNRRERTRSCIHVGKGMGTWTVISLSNWGDQPKVLRIPRLAIYSPLEAGCTTHDEPASSKQMNDDIKGSSSGYHVFLTWSGQYKWLSMKGDNNQYPISRNFLPHETEIFHIRKVTASKPQYIGSDLHFSCGHEVFSFDVSPQENNVKILLKTELNRAGNVFVFIPRVDVSHLRVTVTGKPTRWSVICTVPDEDSCSSTHSCGRIIRIAVIVQADGSTNDGEIMVYY